MSNKEQNQNNNSSNNNSNSSESSSTQNQQNTNDTVRVAPRMVKENFSRQTPDDKKDKKD